MTMKNPNVGCRGFTQLEVLIVTIILVVLAGLLLPALLPAKKRSKRIGCVNNLKQASLGFRLWANDNDDQYPWQVSTNQGGTMEWARSREVFRIFQVASNEIGSPKVLHCPNDTERTPGSTFDLLGNKNISYFVGIGTVYAESTGLLSGDRDLGLDRRVSKPPLTAGPHALTTNMNLRWSSRQHKGFGNIGLSDGSAQQVPNSKLHQVLVDTGKATNWVAIP